MRRPSDAGRPVVIKIGSSSLTSDGQVSETAIDGVVDQLSDIRASGRPVVLVSSGAVAAGLPALGLASRPDDIPGLQAAAAVGQGRLMATYTRSFGRHGLVAGQVLITRDVLADRDQYLHSRAALERMISLGVVPVVNENDTVVVDELRFGDNDRLAAIVAQLVGAGMLVILTDTPGLYATDPRVDEDAELLDAVRHTDEVLESLDHQGGPLGSGGPVTKVAAARMAAWSGIPTVIAPSGESDSASIAVNGGTVGTWVEPHPSGLSARKLWIAFGLPARGSVSIDQGAVAALVSEGRSLLGVGVTDVAGEFLPGQAVEIVDSSGALVGKGRVTMDAASVRAAAGRHSNEAGGAVVHRDDLVVLVGSVPEVG